VCASNSEQAVKLRGLAQQLRSRMLESRNSYYCRLFQNVALEL